MTEQVPVNHPSEHSNTELVKKPLVQNLARIFEFARILKSGETVPVDIVRHIKGKEVVFKGLLPDLFSAYLWMGKEIEPEMPIFLDKILKEGDCFYDVGAHMGYYTQQAAEMVGEKGKVVAFEPVPSTAEVLRENSANYQNTEIDGRAVTDGTQESVEITDFGGMFAGWNTLQAGGEGRISPIFRKLFEKRINPNRVSVKSISIDKLVYEENRRPPDVMKIDVENMEIYVLKGAERTINEYKPIITIETGDQGRASNEMTAECLKFLKDKGYIFYTFDKRGNRIVGHEIQEKYGFTNILCVPEEKADSIFSLLTES